jgi:hypothetical protein
MDSGHGMAERKLGHRDFSPFTRRGKPRTA